ncbi:MAG: ParB/RepB/Spo0J family partition protein [Clostridiales bacterium]
MKRSGLGKGLGALISTSSTADDIESNKIIEEIKSGSVQEIKINDITNNTNQPRERFDDERIEELADSIKKHGILQPIIIKKHTDGYKIVAGERRWRAAKKAGLTEIPSIIKDLSNRDVMEIALIENIQREDLNQIEEAKAYDKLISEYKITQEELSKIIGKSRSEISNTMRLLALHEDVKNYLVNGDITYGHARALLVLDKLQQVKIAETIINAELSVRKTEEIIKGFNKDNNKKLKSRRKNLEPEYQQIEDKLRDFFETKLTFKKTDNDKGKIVIEYNDKEALERILEKLDLNEKGYI